VRGDTICLCPLQVDNIFAFIRQVAVLFRHNIIFVYILYIYATWHLFQHVVYLRHRQQVDLLTLKVVSESHVTLATSVPILVFLGLCFRVRSDVHDSLTDALWDGGIKINANWLTFAEVIRY